MTIRASLFLLLLTAFAAQPSAQNVIFSPSEIQAQGTNYRVYTVPGAPNIQVMLVSPVGSGIYALRENTTLSELLALSGAAATTIESPEVLREVTVRVLRQLGPGPRSVLYQAPLEQVLLESAAQPELMTDDIIEIQVTQQPRGRRVWLEAVQIASSVGTLLLLVLRLSSGAI